MINQKHALLPVAIIGAGPAGVTAAIQFRRYDISAMLFEKDRIGGLLKSANLIENYPGFPKGVSGSKLIELFKKQLEHTKVEVTHENVLSIDYTDTAFLLETEKNRILASRIIIASGTKPKPIPIDVQDRDRDRIFSEVSPLLNENSKHMVIVGAGDAAFDYALNLAKQNTVTILNHSKSISCLPLIQKRVLENHEISYLNGIAVIGAETNLTTGRLRVACEREGRTEEISADFLLFAIGREPNLGFLSDKIRVNDEQLIKSRILYYAGDVRNGLFRQTAIAAGDGLRAAMQVIFDIAEDQ
jgi:thioredoxin reductase